MEIEINTTTFRQRCHTGPKLSHRAYLQPNRRFADLLKPVGPRLVPFDTILVYSWSFLVSFNGCTHELTEPKCQDLIKLGFVFVNFNPPPPLPHTRSLHSGMSDLTPIGQEWRSNGEKLWGF